MRSPALDGTFFRRKSERVFRLQNVHVYWIYTRRRNSTCVRVTNKYMRSTNFHLSPEPPTKWKFVWLLLIWPPRPNARMMKNICPGVVDDDDMYACTGHVLHAVLRRVQWQHVHISPAATSTSPNSRDVRHVLTPEGSIKSIQFPNNKSFAPIQQVESESWIIVCIEAPCWPVFTYYTCSERVANATAATLRNTFSSAATITSHGFFRRAIIAHSLSLTFSFRTNNRFRRYLRKKMMTLWKTEYRDWVTPKKETPKECGIRKISCFDVSSALNICI